MVATEVSTQPATGAGPSSPVVVETQPVTPAGSSESSPAPVPVPAPAAVTTPPSPAPPTDTPATEKTPAQDAAPAAEQAAKDTITREELEREVERRGQEMVRAAVTRAERKLRAQLEADAKAKAEADAKALAEAAAERQLDEDPLGFAETERQRRAQAKAEAERERLFAERELALQRKQWENHAQTFGVDPDDDEVVAVKTFKDLNALLLKRATDDAVLAAAWENPAIQKRHQDVIMGIKTEHAAALARAREAGHVNGQATLLKSGEGATVDLSPPGGGKLPTFDDIVRNYADNPTPENAKAYATAMRDMKRSL